ncbi:hypothetical protein H257_04840 [Aphanomyces astaci]|uniref:Uncharacterized protein n=1 Tax=Aphanomyces astaci TaxID=112090 RepID=W4GW38_APHAT|nr:hypothetical protein H257_04840 [Aphanomyces astaci]ETV83113.1 hypothetical protein H257_04840 [Aphanomyces astaci]|eukprot:XP_009827784.1 hypothetical protein H257_04840 [Aphanomyces astaci]
MPASGVVCPPVSNARFHAYMCKAPTRRTMWTHLAATGPSMSATRDGPAALVTDHAAALHGCCPCDKVFQCQWHKAYESSGMGFALLGGQLLAPCYVQNASGLRRRETARLGLLHIGGPVCGTMIKLSVHEKHPLRGHIPTGVPTAPSLACSNIVKS